MSNAYNQYHIWRKEHPITVTEAIIFPNSFPEKTPAQLRMEFKISSETETHLDMIVKPALQEIGLDLKDITESITTLSHITNLEKMLEGRPFWIRSRLGHTAHRLPLGFYAGKVLPAVDMKKYFNRIRKRKYPQLSKFHAP